MIWLRLYSASVQLQAATQHFRELTHVSLSGKKRKPRINIFQLSEFTSGEKSHPESDSPELNEPSNYLLLIVGIKQRLTPKTTVFTLRPQIQIQLLIFDFSTYFQCTVIAPYRLKAGDAVGFVLLDVHCSLNPTCD